METPTPSAEFPTHEQTYRYLWCNVSLLLAIPYQLPGVFAANPYPNARRDPFPVTQQWEAEMYMVPAVLAMVLNLGKTLRP